MRLEGSRRHYNFKSDNHIVKGYKASSSSKFMDIKYSPRILEIYLLYQTYPDGGIELIYDFEPSHFEDWVNLSEDEAVEKAEYALYKALKRKFELPD